MDGVWLDGGKSEGERCELGRREAKAARGRGLVVARKWEKCRVANKV